MKYSRIFFFNLLFLCNAAFVGCGNTKQSSDGTMQGEVPFAEKNNWGFTGAGGGGAMFNPAVSPFNPDYAFVSCDMTGAYVTHNGGASWRVFNLHAPVDFYVFDPLDSNVVYANSLALFKSEDKGATWRMLYPDSSAISGLVSKGDHANEIVVTKDSTKRKVLALAVDPTNSRLLYAAISINNNAALYISRDGGIRWEKEKDLEDGAKNIFVNTASPPQDRTLYVTGKKTVTVRLNGEWKINDGPESVEKMNEYSGGYDQQNKKYIIYGISGTSYFNADKDQSGIFFTEDGGATWENRQQGIMEQRINNADMPEWRAIATSAMNPAVLYVSYNNLKTNKTTTCIGVAKSEDYGRTWALSWKDELTSAGNTPSANFKSGWINDRFGPTWGENPFSIGVAPANPDICYATDFGRTVKTVDGGKTWEQVYTQKKPGGDWTSRGLEVTTSYAVVFDPFDMKHVFIANTDIGLMESIDGAESWKSATVNNGIPKSWVNSTYWLTFDPEVKGKAWAVMSATHDLPRPKMWRAKNPSTFKGGILFTQNSGASWEPVSSSIGEAAFTHILIVPPGIKNARTLFAWVFGKGVFKSIDGGKSWALKNKGIEGSHPFAWRITRREQDGVLFLVVNRQSEDGSIGNGGDGAVYRSDDGAETWKKMILPVGTNAPTSIIVDPENPGTIMLSAWGRVTANPFTPDIGGGIFLSHDEGKTWVPVLQQDQHIHDITFDSRIKTYYACGFNNAAYRSKNGGETWEQIKGYDFKWGKRVDIDPRDALKVFIVTFGGGVWYGAVDAE